MYEIYPTKPVNSDNFYRNDNCQNDIETIEVCRLEGKVIILIIVLSIENVSWMSGLVSSNKFRTLNITKNKWICVK